MNADEKLDELISMVAVLVGQLPAKSWYTTQEFGRLVGRASYTVREYCRQGFLQAQKRPRGRGAERWVISASELERFQREGLLPLPKTS
jgi:Helix-turn-helix domain